jgi:hypothetical protein
LAPAAHPYPAPKTDINDHAVADSGGNFGRVARQGLEELERYVMLALEERVAGIRADDWIAFFKAFTDASDAFIERKKVDKFLEAHFAAREEDAERASALLSELIRLLSPRDGAREAMSP